MASARTPGGFPARFVAWTDRLNSRIGVAVSWLTLAMVAVGAYNAVVRYLGRFTGWNLSSNAYLELQWYMFSLVFLLGAAYALLTGAHVRVDVILSRLPERWRRRIHLWGSLLFLIPFAVVGLVALARCRVAVVGGIVAVCRIAGGAGRRVTAVIAVAAGKYKHEHNGDRHDQEGDGPHHQSEGTIRHRVSPDWSL